MVLNWDGNRRLSHYDISLTPASQEQTADFRTAPAQLVQAFVDLVPDRGDQCRRDGQT